MESIIETFHIDWRIIVAQAVNFALVLAVLYFFALKPLQRVMRERAEKIRKGLGDAERHTKLLSGAQAEREAILAEARGESGKIIEEARQAGEEARQKLLASAKEEITRLKTDSERRSREEKARLLQELKQEMGGLVVEAIEKTLGDVLDARSQGRMVEQALAVIRESAGDGKKRS